MLTYIAIDLDCATRIFTCYFNVQCFLLYTEVAYFLVENNPPFYIDLITLDYNKTGEPLPSSACESCMHTIMF